MKKFLFLLAPILLLGVYFFNAPTTAATDYYASPTGTGTQCSFAQPCGLQTLLNLQNTTGSNLYMRGGTYNGKYVSNLTGGVVQSYPNEWAKVDGFVTTTLTNAITATQTNGIVLADASKFPEGTTFTVHGDAGGEKFEEHININSKSGNILTSVNRGWGNWSGLQAPKSHPANAIVVLGGNNFEIFGSDTIYKNFEITNSDPTRSWNDFSDGQSSPHYRGECVWHQGARTKIVNLVLHDCQEGLFSGQSGTGGVDSEVYGNVIFNNGYRQNVGLEGNQYGGHGWYIQNRRGSTKAYKENITFNNNVMGAQEESVSGDTVDITNVGNVVVNNTFLVGADVGTVDNVNISDSFFYNTNQGGTSGNLRMGYADDNLNSMSITNCYFGQRNDVSVNTNPSNLDIGRWQTVNISGNTFVSAGGGWLYTVQARTPLSGGTYIFNNNRYYDLTRNDPTCAGGTFRHAFTFNTAEGVCGGSLRFGEWKQFSGFDAAVTDIGTATPADPNGFFYTQRTAPNKTFVRANAYQVGRANIIVYNWIHDTVVNVDVSAAGLTDGQPYEIRNVQHYFTNIQTGVFHTANPYVALNMSDTEITQPVGTDLFERKNVMPEFGMFVILPAGVSGTPTPTITPSVTPSISPSPTPTLTFTPTSTPTFTATPTATLTVTPSPTPSGACTGSNCVNVNEAQTFQTMTGWEATDFAGYRYIPQADWDAVKDEIFTKAVGDLGINRIRLEVTSGVENNVDYYTQWINGQITEDQWVALSYKVVNDDNDPNHINPAGFQWASVDDKINNILIPLKQKLNERGETLHVNINFVDFKRAATGTSYQHKSNPAEYAELVLATYQHLQNDFGLTPDSWEMILEPDTTTANWSNLQVANAVKATGDRLTAAGITPHLIAPSVTNAGNFASYVNSIAGLSGAMQYIDTLSYHRYGGLTPAQATTIKNLGATHNKKLAMLEFIGANYLNLHEDLKSVNNSAWQQFTLAAPDEYGSGDDYIDIMDNLTAQIEDTSKYFRQYFRYIRKGAVRIGATNTGNPFIDPLAFKNVDGRIVVVSTVSGAPSPVTFGVNGLPAGIYGTYYTSNNTTTELPFQTITNGQAVNVTLPTGTVGAVTVYRAATISGTITYGNAIGNPSVRPVPNVSMNAVGYPFDHNVTVTTNAQGQYSFTGFLFDENYVVTPSKIGGNNGEISSFDAAMVARYASGIINLTPTQKLVADVSGDGQVTSFDAALISRFVVGSSESHGRTGDWIFVPVNRFYWPPYNENILGHDYVALLMGDVSGNWTEHTTKPASKKNATTKANKR